jgi:anti-sigma factor RsiW
MDPEISATRDRGASACPAFEPLLEDYVEGQLGGVEANTLADHLKACAGCRAGLDDAVRGTRFLRTAESTPDPGPGFARLVMARIREQQNAQSRSIWLPLIAFGWRFAMSATLALALLIAYAAWKPAPRQELTVMRTSEGRDLIYDPGSPPATRDDVLLMVAETDHGK